MGPAERSVMTLTGTTIYLHGFGNGRSPSLAQRLEMRKACGPYMWRVGPAGERQDGRGYYAADDDGTPSAHDSSFALRACERPARYRSWHTGEMTEFFAVVLRLPRERGFLAGWTMGKGMASSVDFYIHSDELEAWRDADMQARHACERDDENEQREPEEEA